MSLCAGGGSSPWHADRRVKESPVWTPRQWARIGSPHIDSREFEGEHVGAHVLKQLGRRLGAYGGLPASACLPDVTATPSVHVEGFGDLVFPLTVAQRRRLLRLAEAAPYGKGEKTLTDRELRDAWQIPTSLVTVDWKGALEGVLATAADALGLPPGHRFEAQFHSLLAYEKGQFFVLHQDSEKGDGMVATLVVVPPNPHKGGDLVVHDHDEPSVYTGSSGETTCVALYADTRHEVRPVKSGMRITLTYTLFLVSDGSEPRVDLGDIEQVAELLTTYFGGDADAVGRAEAAPTRLAYLLDHEYTPASLSSAPLKGGDARASAVLRAAARRVECEVVLALVDEHEMREALPADDFRPWSRYDDDDDVSVDDVADGDVIDHEVTITDWVRPSGEVQKVGITVSDDEVAAGRPLDELAPYAIEFEGYMGNYGNTIDRWYRRGALLVWPRAKAFANRAVVSPVEALREVEARLDAGEGSEVVSDLRKLVPEWDEIVRRVRRGAGRSSAERLQADLLALALSLALRLGDADLAAALLDAFGIEELAPDGAGVLIGLARLYGDVWVEERMWRWVRQNVTGGPFASATPEEWMGDLPELCRELGDTPELVEALLGAAWERLRDRLEQALSCPRAGQVRVTLVALGVQLAALLKAASAAGAVLVLTSVVDRCARDDLLDASVSALENVPDELRGDSELRRLTDFVTGRLRDKLAIPPREADDWSIVPLSGCRCELCARLGEFLASPSAQTLEWPLPQPKRRHVHARIDDAELPVTHGTRRVGRPYVLVLTKTPALFDREREGRVGVTPSVPAWGETTRPKSCV